MSGYTDIHEQAAKSWYTCIRSNVRAETDCGSAFFMLEAAAMTPKFWSSSFDWNWKMRARRTACTKAHTPERVPAFTKAGRRERVQGKSSAFYADKISAISQVTLINIHTSQLPTRSTSLIHILYDSKIQNIRAKFKVCSMKIISCYIIYRWIFIAKFERLM